jgi:hypothetical protein
LISFVILAAWLEGFSLAASTMHGSETKQVPKLSRAPARHGIFIEGSSAVSGKSGNREMQPLRIGITMSFFAHFGCESYAGLGTQSIGMVTYFENF